MSNIRDTDLVLVSRGGTPYDCPASELSNRLRDGDYLLVSRSGTHYKVSGSNINNISDNDTLLISRGSTPYKVTGADFKTLLGPSKSELFGSVNYWGNSSSNNPVTGVDGLNYRSTVIVRPSNASQPVSIFGKGPGQTSINKDYFLGSPSLRFDQRIYTNYLHTGWSTGYPSFNQYSGSGSSLNTQGNNYVACHFRGTEGFHDHIQYTGDGNSKIIYHNLGETPGCIIIINRNPDAVSYTDANFCSYALWHHVSPTHNHIVGGNPNDAHNDDSPNPGIIQFGGPSSLCISDVNSSSFMVRSVSGAEDDYINYPGEEYVALVFAGKSASSYKYIKCGQYIGNGSTSGRTLSFDFAPSFFFQWRAYSYPSNYGQYSTARICAFKDDSTSGYAHTWDYSYPYGNSNLNLVSSWGSDSLTLSGSGPGVWGWNENNVAYNYIAV